MAHLAFTTTEPTEEMTVTESALLTSYPFFAAVLFNQLEVIPTRDPRIPTAGTDGRKMWVNIDWFASISPPERVFTYCHEIAHAIWLHMHRGKAYESTGYGPDQKEWSHKRWNFAADYIINDMLISDKVGVMPQGCLHDRSMGTYKDDVDTVYCRVPHQSGGGGQGGGGGNGDGPNGQGGDPMEGQAGFDVHITDGAELTDGEKAEMEVSVKQALADAKARGSVPGSLREMIDNLLDPKVDWSEYLTEEISTAVARAHSSWNKANRRRMVRPLVDNSPAVILPSSVSTSCGTIVIEIDTSGSISRNEITVFLSETYSIVCDYIPEEVYILWVDSDVKHVDYLDDVAEFEDIIERVKTQPIPGGGGTDMTRVFDYVEDYGIEPDTCIILTDGYTQFGDEQDFPVVWGITAENMVNEPDHGRSVYIDIPSK